MKRVFISQPMSGKTDVEILTTRAEAAQKAQEYLGEPIEILDSFRAKQLVQSLQVIGQSITMMSQADLAVFIKGWEKDKGCKIEHLCATEYGINTLEM